MHKYRLETTKEVRPHWIQQYDYERKAQDPKVWRCLHVTLHIQFLLIAVHGGHIQHLPLPCRVKEIYL